MQIVIIQIHAYRNDGLGFIIRVPLGLIGGGIFNVSFIQRVFIPLTLMENEIRQIHFRVNFHIAVGISKQGIIKEFE
ncbi:hypothetical protein D3C75_248540 [compost metagenome]